MTTDHVMDKNVVGDRWVHACMLEVHMLCTFFFFDRFFTVISTEKNSRLKNFALHHSCSSQRFQQSTYFVVHILNPPSIFVQQCVHVAVCFFFDMLVSKCVP